MNKIFWERADSIVFVKNNDNSESENDIIEKIISETTDQDNSKKLQRYKLWIAHTNFVINNDIIKDLSKIPGVELIHRITQYRMRIAVGKLFEENNVIPLIEQICLVTSSNFYGHYSKEIHDKIKNFQEEHEDKFWVLYLDPSGYIDGITTYVNDSAEKVKDKYSSLEEIQNNIGGVLLSNLSNG